MKYFPHVKALLAVVAFALSSQGYADSGKIVVPTFKAQISEQDPSIKITSADLVLGVEFCAIADCDGGPSQTKLISLPFQQGTDGNVSVQLDKTESFKAGAFIVRFKACYAGVNLNGVSQDGTKYIGGINLLEMMGKRACASSESTSEEIRKTLASPQTAWMVKKIDP